MARVAFNVLTLAERLPLQVESLEVWGTTLLIGTNEGHLLRYQVPEVPSEDGRKQMQTISHEINWAKKPVSQMQVLYVSSVCCLLSSFIFFLFKYSCLQIDMECRRTIVTFWWQRQMSRSRRTSCRTWRRECRP
ncbi:MAG: hypothetical protein Q8P67_08770 [archaeon]|nr:hypothetical protein [archaeon]